MTEVSFYHLTSQTLEEALPLLLERVVGAGLKALVRVGSKERAESLDGALWTYDEVSFLAHGIAGAGHEDAQPILISSGDDGGGENSNSAEILVLVDGLDAADASDVDAFKRCLYMFDGRSDDLTSLARTHWKAFSDGGHDVTYWQQGEAGGWEKKA